jgi:hypothetical protein
MMISAVAHEGLDPLVEALWGYVTAYRAENSTT